MITTLQSYNPPFIMDLYLQELKTTDIYNNHFASATASVHGNCSNWRGVCRDEDGVVMENDEIDKKDEGSHGVPLI